MTTSEINRITVPDRHSVTYGSYLKVHELLSLQQPLSQPAQHDEMLFIVIHQVYELWFKQLLHELDKAELAIDADQVLVFQRIAKRMGAIQQVLTHQVDVLETMTPVDFNTFRERLNPASGFQSYQFRVLECRLGSKDEVYLKFHGTDPRALAALEKALAAPSLYDRILGMLARRGLPVPPEVLERDVRKHYEASEGVREAILKIYKESDRYYDLYSTMESLMDLDEGLLLWRYRHIAMVERMIGSRKGTGGSSGVKYLSGTLTKRFFPEIWEVRSFLGDSQHGYGS
jgi:tryptophan 2,3-dioxygenase